VNDRHGALYPVQNASFIEHVPQHTCQALLRLVMGTLSDLNLCGPKLTIHPDTPVQSKLSILASSFSSILGNLLDY
jgi:hypothetical protein